MAHRNRVVHHYSGVRFDKESASWKLETAFADDREKAEWVNADDLLRCGAINAFFLQFNDLFEEFTRVSVKKEKDAGVDMIEKDDYESPESDVDETDSDLDAFIDNTPEDELQTFESPNSKKLEEAEKEIKREKKEKRKRKLLKELQAEGKLVKKKNTFVLSSDEEGV
ncbi:hypothetical protein AAVH_35022 [Aphelenchoides avenae]|nr:hypothetical protein AAVH_35022 [Aphelenchus avenae]